MGPTHFGGSPDRKTIPPSREIRPALIPGPSRWIRALRPERARVREEFEQVWNPSNCEVWALEKAGPVGPGGFLPGGFLSAGGRALWALGGRRPQAQEPAQEPAREADLLLAKLREEGGAASFESTAPRRGRISSRLPAIV